MANTCSEKYSSSQPWRSSPGPRSPRASHGAGPEQRYTVRAGDTLWSIAVKHYAGDPRDAIYRIDHRNHLGGSLLVPGERLVLPSAG